MKHLIFLLFIIPLSLFGQVESQFNGTLNIFSGYRIGSTNTFTISGIFSSTTSQYTSNQVAIGDVIQAQSGSRFYWFHIYSIASSSGGAITCNVRDSTSTITVAPTGINTIFRPTPNRRLPLQADGMSNVAKVSSFNTLAMKVDQLGSGTGTANCEQTLTKTSHGFKKLTPVYWNGSAWARPTYDTIIPTYIVIDSTSANTFKVANCGNYATTLTTGMYWFSGTSPGYTTTPGMVKTPLFEVTQGRLILQPFTGFNLAVTGIEDKNGIISALLVGDVNIVGAISSDLRVQNTRVQIEDRFKVGTDSSFIHNPVVDTTLLTGKFAIKNGVEYYRFPQLSPGTGKKIIVWNSGVPSFTNTIPTNLTTGQIPYSNGTDLIGSTNLTYSNGILSLGNNNVIGQTNLWFTSSAVANPARTFFETNSEGTGTNFLRGGGTIVLGGFASFGKVQANGYGAVGSNYYLDQSGVLRYASGDVALGINFAASNFEFWGAGSGTINAAMTRTVRATLNSTGIALGKATAPNYAVDATGDGYISLKLGVGIVPSAIATFQVAGSQSTSILSISANTTLDATHNTVIVPNGSAFTVTLPSASGITGRWYRIVNKTAGIITIGSYVNLLGTTVTTLGIATSIVVQSDGTNWQQIQ